jgi:hypothetical protein
MLIDHIQSALSTTGEYNIIDVGNVRSLEQVPGK